MKSILTLPMKTTTGLVPFLVAITGFAAEFRLPAFEKIQLANGLTAVMMERHDVPLIAVRTVLKAGAVSDGNQSGLANLRGTPCCQGAPRSTKKCWTRPLFSGVPELVAARG